jgi:hypothetical protein
LPTASRSPNCSMLATRTGLTVTPTEVERRPGSSNNTSAPAALHSVKLSSEGAGAAAGDQLLHLHACVRAHRTIAQHTTGVYRSSAVNCGPGALLPPLQLKVTSLLLSRCCAC